MNREQFMRELERLLSNIPESERKEALAYYEDYFNDAGPENEAQVIAELGHPYKVAENIKEGLRGNMGYQNSGAGYQNAGYQHIGTQNVYAGNNTPAVASSTKEPMPTWAIVLIVLACVVFSPFILGAAGTAIGVIFGFLGTLIGIIVATFASGVALIVAGIAVFIAAFPCMVVSGFVGIAMIGVSLLLIAIGILLIMAGVWVCGWALPTFVKWVIKMCKKLFSKEEAQAAV
ncbi:MAG: DUF1700 domain-containing protein [Lachnospiraceae bacterium]|nr:DUF1700 domain-containing protein [Lachnospiraceae bacterium]